MENQVINSGADLAAMVPADLFAGSENIPVPDNTGDPIEDSTFDIGEDPTPEPDTTIDPPADEDPEPEPTPEPAAAEPPPAATDDLPEGVKKGKDRNGKDGYFVQEGRWGTVYGNHKMVQEASNLIGEPLTADGIRQRHEALLAEEKLYTDLQSGDPAKQGDVLNFFFDEMKSAQSRGEVGVDPTIPFTQSFYERIKDHPDAHAHLRLAAARDLADEMFKLSATSGDPDLAKSARYIVAALTGASKQPNGRYDKNSVRAIAERMGLPFYSDQEMQGLSRGADPLAVLRQENEQLRQQVNGGVQPNPNTAQYGDWRKATAKSLDPAVVEKAVMPALSAISDNPVWKENPDAFKDLVVNRLHSQIAEVMKADDGFRARISGMYDRAKAATSQQVREKIAQQIVDAHVNKAALIAEQKKRSVLDFATNALKGQSAANKTRREAGQNRTPPRGASGTAPQSLVPKVIPGSTSDYYDPKTALRQLFGQ